MTSTLIPYVVDAAYSRGSWRSIETFLFLCPLYFKKISRRRRRRRWRTNENERTNVRQTIDSGRGRSVGRSVDSIERATAALMMVAGRREKYPVFLNPSGRSLSWWLAGGFYILFMMILGPDRTEAAAPIKDCQIDAIIHNSLRDCFTFVRIYINIFVWIHTTLVRRSGPVEFPRPKPIIGAVRLTYAERGRPTTEQTRFHILMHA